MQANSARLRVVSIRTPVFAFAKILAIPQIASVVCISSCVLFFVYTKLYFSQPRRRGYSKKLQLCIKIGTLRGDASQFGETEGSKYSDSGFCFRKNPRHPSDRLGCLHLLLRAFFCLYKVIFFATPPARLRGKNTTLHKN